MSPGRDKANRGEKEKGPEGGGARLNQQQLEGIGRPAEDGTRVTSTQEWEKWRGSQGPQRKQTKIGLVRGQRPSVKIKTLQKGLSAREILHRRQETQPQTSKDKAETASQIKGEI